MPDYCQQYTYDELTVGQKAEFTFVITDEVIVDFAALSGDKSPLHTDAAYAATTAFGRPVAHGMIAGMLFSRLVGMELPGKYCVYLSQQMTFHHPMFAGDVLVVHGVITQKSDAFKTVTLTTTIQNAASDELLVHGEALVRVVQ